jgi:hypothetical protein
VSAATFSFFLSMQQIIEPVFDSVISLNSETYFHRVLVSVAGRRHMFDMAATENLRMTPTENLGAASTDHTIAVARWDDDGGASRNPPLTGKSGRAEQSRATAELADSVGAPQWPLHISSTMTDPSCAASSPAGTRSTTTATSRRGHSPVATNASSDSSSR